MALALVTTSMAVVRPADSERVHIVGHAILAGDPLAMGPDSQCVDKSYVLKSWWLSGSFTWYYNGTGAPTSVASTALASITTSTETSMKGTNRCGLPATLPFAHKYAGATTAKPQVSVDATCTGNDSRSVTGWGKLPPKVLAYTCTYYRSNGTILASDVLIDNVVNPWFTTMPASCSGRFDLQTTMTHERLHTLGLAHVDPATSPGQVMIPSTAPCDTSRRLLGSGDYAGVKALAARTG
ncbi:peptidase M10A [Alloactinosynnema sp. L-07]|uniref:peptidase M10A n=1 Tax=Alloactinosynnema sp. L-07 TaxID=1653480 RepID=UPI0012FCB779|nr:peptidase M10A [Alloactinosynnema sp. L-07]